MKKKLAYCSKARICISFKKTSQQISHVGVTPKENFDLAEALESVYPLLEIVFSYLDCSDLRRAALVKKSWCDIAFRVLAKRNKVSWMTVLRKRGGSYAHYSSTFPYNNVQIGIVLFNSRAVSVTEFFCCHESYSQPRIRFIDFLSREVMPHASQYCMIGCTTVVSTFSKQVENRVSIPLFDCGFIPPIENISVSIFNCDPFNKMDRHIKPNERLKCVLMFCENDLGDNIYKVFDCLTSWQGYHQFAVGGGVIRRGIIFPNQSNYSPNALCVTFAQDVNSESCFNSASVVINGSNLTPEEFEDKLIQFKQKIIIRNNSLAVRICCAAKIRKNHETRIFNKVFPDTPLLGLEAEGEIGWNHSDFSEEETTDVAESKPKKMKQSYPVVHHQWSTVIVFLTWGHIVKEK